MPSSDPDIPDAPFSVGPSFGAPDARVTLGMGLSKISTGTGIVIGPNTDVAGQGCMTLGFTLLDEVTGACEP